MLIWINFLLINLKMYLIDTTAFTCKNIFRLSKRSICSRCRSSRVVAVSIFSISDEFFVFLSVNIFFFWLCVLCRCPSDRTRSRQQNNNKRVRDSISLPRCRDGNFPSPKNRLKFSIKCLNYVLNFSKNAIKISIQDFDRPWWALQVCFWVHSERTRRSATNRRERTAGVSAICWGFRAFLWFSPHRLVQSSWTQKTNDRVANELSNDVPMNGTKIITTGAGIFWILCLNFFRFYFLNEWFSSNEFALVRTGNSHWQLAVVDVVARAEIPAIMTPSAERRPGMRLMHLLAAGTNSVLWRCNSIDTWRATSMRPLSDPSDYIYFYFIFSVILYSIEIEQTASFWDCSN